MPRTSKENSWELLQRAIGAFDAEIAELQTKRANLAALLATLPKEAGATQGANNAVNGGNKPGRKPGRKKGTRTLSPEAKEKIRAAQLKRWAAKKKAANAGSKTSDPKATKAVAKGKGKAKGGKKAAPVPAAATEAA